MTKLVWVPTATSDRSRANCQNLNWNSKCHVPLPPAAPKSVIPNSVGIKPFLPSPSLKSRPLPYSIFKVHCVSACKIKLRIHGSRSHGVRAEQSPALHVSQRHFHVRTPLR